MIIQVQGQDEIIVNAPVEKIWSLISDSKRLLDWGPPVRGVQVMGTSGQPEGLGSYRRVDAEFNGQRGHFIERRIEHIEGKKMAVQIEEENFDIFRFLTDVGSSLELEAVEPNKTRVIFSFFHRPKGIVGHIMNRLIILRQQRRNRLAALKSLKDYAEKNNHRA
jgi:Polyketide cyclase / dehydrase and lipid transport